MLVVQRRQAGLVVALAVAFEERLDVNGVAPPHGGDDIQHAEVPVARVAVGIMRVRTPVLHAEQHTVLSGAIRFHGGCPRAPIRGQRFGGSGHQTEDDGTRRSQCHRALNEMQSQGQFAVLANQFLLRRLPFGRKQLPLVVRQIERPALVVVGEPGQPALVGAEPEVGFEVGQQVACRRAGADRPTSSGSSTRRPRRQASSRPDSRATPRWSHARGGPWRP